MDNYAVAQQAAEKRFCTYDMAKIAEKCGVFLENGHICTVFLGDPVRVDTATGKVTVAGEAADFCQALTIFDWLCDRKPDAKASGEFCPVSSLPGVLVSGSGLVMNTAALAAKIDKDPQKFREICQSMGGVKVRAGDLGFQLPVFPDLPMELKFYFSDEEFPASLTFLWDKNILDFIRYETVYYLAGCLQNKLL